MYIYIHGYIDLYIYIKIYACICTYVCIYIHIYTYLYRSIQLYRHIYLSISIYVCVCLCGGRGCTRLTLCSVSISNCLQPHHKNHVFNLVSRPIDYSCECEHNNSDSLDARLFLSVVLPVAPAVTIDEASFSRILRRWRWRRR